MGNKGYKKATKIIQEDVDAIYLKRAMSCAELDFEEVHSCNGRKNVRTEILHIRGYGTMNLQSIRESQSYKIQSIRIHGEEDKKSELLKILKEKQNIILE